MRPAAGGGISVDQGSPCSQGCAQPCCGWSSHLEIDGRELTRPGVPHACACIAEWHTAVKAPDARAVCRCMWTSLCICVLYECLKKHCKLWWVMFVLVSHQAALASARSFDSDCTTRVQTTAERVSPNDSRALEGCQDTRQHFESRVNA